MLLEQKLLCPKKNDKWIFTWNYNIETIEYYPVCLEMKIHYSQGKELSKKVTPSELWKWVNWQATLLGKFIDSVIYTHLIISNKNIPSQVGP